MNKEQLIKLIEKEGDSLQWEYTCSNGVIFTCDILRNSLKFLCGYVNLTKDNSLYGVDYDDIYNITNIDVHGGLTYTNETETGDWKIGFDCGHLGDLSPFYLLNDMSFNIIGNDSYRDMDYVKSECESLCEQICKFSKSIERYNKISQII